MRFINHSKFNIGIIGDYDAKKTSHTATNNAIEYAAKYLNTDVDINWLPTPLFLKKAEIPRLESFDGFWASPGSPYQSLEGAVRGIQLAREMNRPFIGT